MDVAYREYGLRMSVARDALTDRGNTGTNAPAFIDVVMRPGTGATVDVMLKGGGSDNASVLAMLDPAEGAAGVRAVVLAAVEAKATSACPPLLVGVGVGATFDKVARSGQEGAAAAASASRTPTPRSRRWRPSCSRRSTPPASARRAWAGARRRWACTS